MVESAPTTGYSKIRVVFDTSEGRNASSYSSAVTTSSTPGNSPSPLARQSSPTRMRGNILTSNQGNNGKLNLSSSGYNTTSSTNGLPAVAYGDIAEPFWIQLAQSNTTTSTSSSTQGQSISYTPVQLQYNAPLTPRYGNDQDITKLTQNYSMWCDPDEAFITEIKKHITITDKIIFWEMAKAIMEMPKLSEHCDSIIRNSKDLAAVLKRTEFKFLWSPDAPDLLPKDAASELISAAYVVNC